MKIKSDKQFNLILTVVAFLLTVVILLFNSHFFYRYDVNYKPVNNNTRTESIFFEFSERETKEVRIQKLIEQNDLYAIYIYDFNDAFEEQTNFKADDLWLKHFYFFDLNGDNYKEIVFIYPRNDSLFLSAIDHKNKAYLFLDDLLLVRGKERFAEKWDLKISIAGINNNTNEEPSIFFSIWAGYSILPRGVYSFNLISKELNKFEMGAAIHTLFWGDEKTLIALSSAPGNTWRLDTKPEYDDSSSFVFFFDKKLNLLNYFELKEEYNGLDFVHSFENEKYITAIKNKKNRRYTLANINFEGKIVKEILLDSLKQYIRVVSKNTNQKNIFLLTDGELVGYNQYLDKIFSIKNPLFRDNGKVIDLNLGHAVLFLYSDEEKFMLCNEEFSTLNVFVRNINNFWYQADPSYAILEKDKIKIIENGFDKNGVIIITYVLRLYLVPVYFLSLFSVLLSFFFITKIVTEKTSTIYSYFINSTNRLNEPILIFNNKHKLIYSNKAARREFGVQHSFWFSKKSESVLNRSEEFVEIMMTALKGKRVPPKEISLLHLNNFMKLKCTAVSLMAPWGLVIAVYIRLDDISKQIYEEREKVLSHSIQKVAHEIKTPLASVLLNLESIEQNSNVKNESLLKDLNTARNEIFRVRNFINNFLKLTNAQTPTFKSIAAENVINNALLRFTTYMEKNIKIEITGDLSEKIWCDPFQIQEVLQVFIENAIDAMEGKGQITIHCKKVSVATKDFLEFRISDEGPGIDEKIKNSLFDPYTTTKIHGTGMGLAIAKKILEDHECKIEITSNFDGGTIVVFKLNVVK